MESSLGIIYLLAIFNMPILLNVKTIMRWFEMYSGLEVNFLTYRQIQQSQRKIKLAEITMSSL